MPITIQLRRGTLSQWTGANPILASGEPGLDLTNMLLKVGDGSRNWNNLPYVGVSVGLSGGTGIGLSQNPDGSYTISSLLSISGIGLSSTYNNSPSGNYTLSLSTGLQSIANLNIPVNNYLYTTSRNTFSTGLITSAARSLLASNGHTHNVGDITNFNNIVSGLIGSSVVYTTGDQTIGGIKTFSKLNINGTGVSLSGHKHLVSDITGLEILVPDNVVFTTGNQNISGIKIFNSVVNINNLKFNDSSISAITGNTINIGSNNGGDALEIKVRHSGGGPSKLSLYNNDSSDNSQNLLQFLDWWDDNNSVFGMGFNRDTLETFIVSESGLLFNTYAKGGARIFTEEVGLDIYSTSAPYIKSFKLKNGNCGINTYGDPQYPLEVAGTGLFHSGILINNSSGILINNNTIATNSGSIIKIITPSTGNLYIGPLSTSYYLPSNGKTIIGGESTIGSTAGINLGEFGVGIGNINQTEIYSPSNQVIYINDDQTVAAGNFTDLQVNNIPVSISGHVHGYTEISNFCTGVALCVNTPLLAGTGVSLTYVADTGLYISIDTNLDTNLANVVRTSGNQTINGIKSFTTGILFFSNIVAPPRIVFPSGRSNGTRLSFGGNTTSYQAEYAIGLENNAMWFSTPTISGSYNWYEGPNKIASLDGSGVFNIQGNTSQINVDNLRLDNNTLSSTNTNGNINIVPDGTGIVSISGNINKVKNIEHSWGNYRIGAFFDNSNRMGLRYTTANRGLNLFSTSDNISTVGGISFSTRVLTPGTSDTDYGTERMRITGSGYVGIGTNDPSSQLHVVGTGIISSKLGIGTNNPSSTLDVNGDLSAISGNFTSLKIDNISNPTSNPLSVEGSDGSYIRLNNNNSISIEAFNNDCSVSAIEGGSLNLFSLYGGNVNISTLYGDTPGNINIASESAINIGTYVNINNGAWVFDGDNLLSDFGIFYGCDGRFTNYLQGMFVNCGIPSTNLVEAPLAVKGSNDEAVNATARFYDYNNNEKITIDKNCNVGINTNNPLSQLHVNGSGIINSGLFLTDQTASTITSFDSNKKLVSLSTGTYPSLTELTYLKGATSSIQNQLNSSSIIRTTGSQTITGNKTFDGSTTTVFTTGAKVGIGTDSPSYLLDIYDTVSLAPFRASDSNNNYIAIGPPEEGANVVRINSYDYIHLTTNNGTVYISGSLLINGQPLKTAAGLSNVTNDAQIKKLVSTSGGYIPTWNGSTGDALNIGYSVETTLSGSSSSIARADAVKTYVDNAIVSGIAANDVMIFKQAINCSASPNYPAADKGWTYNVSAAGKIGGASGTIVEVNDVLICTTDGTPVGSQAAVGSNWIILQTNIVDTSIFVRGPSSAISGNFPIFDGSTGKIIKDSSYSYSAFSLAGHGHYASEVYVPDLGLTYILTDTNLEGVFGSIDGAINDINGAVGAAYTYIDAELIGKATSSHTHGNITNAGAIGSASNLPIITTTSGVLTTGTFGSSANTFCQGNDSRLSDTRNTTSSITVNNSGAGDTSFVFNGSTAKTISYNSVGAPSTSGTNASGTWNINIGGNADTVTSGVYTNRSITINGTTNQITSSTGTQDLSSNRTWTLSLPQDIHTSASPTFTAITLNGTVNARASASSTTTTQIPVFTGDPSETTRNIVTRTPAQLLSDIGAYASTNPSGYTTNVGTVTSVASLILGTTGTDLSSTVVSGTTTPVITLNVPTASSTVRGVLSSGDWTTFNNKAASDQTMFIGTTSVPINRSSDALVLTGITSMDGNASTVTDGVYTTGNQSISGIKTFFNNINIGNFSLSSALVLTNNTFSNTLSSTSGNIIINPYTSGSLQRDNGGNTRGIYAVDWQSVRSTGTMIAAGNHSCICGGQNNSTVGARSVVCGGGSNSAIGIASVVCGGNINSAVGVRSFIGGGTLNMTEAENATIGGGSNNNAYGLTSTIGGGNLNVASGDGSTIAGGNSNRVGDGATVGGGYANNASAYRSTIGGGNNNTASSRFSTIIGGYGAKTTNKYEVAHSAGPFANAGDAQHVILMAKVQTTGVSLTNLFTENVGDRLIIPDKTTWTFDIKLSAYNNTDNLGAGWNIQGCIQRAGSTTTLIGTNVVNRWIPTSMSGVTASAIAATTNNALTIQVAGLANKDIRWVGVVDISQVSYDVV